jgi:hypothetical protein
MISFSCFGFMAVALDNPDTQTVSHSFPKVSAALQRNFGTDDAYRARRLVFSLFCSGDATAFAKSGSGSLFGIAHRT